jgi:hypothetical protein
VVTRLDKVNSVICNSVNQPVFLGNSPGPASGQLIPKRLRFSDSFEGISQHGFRQIEQLDRNATVNLHPIPQILPEPGLEDGDPFILLWQRKVGASVQPQSQAFLARVPPD